MQKLLVYLEGGQVVYFNPNLKKTIQERTKAARLTLMVFFCIQSTVY